MDNGASSYRRYLNGDEEAFRQIVKEYFDPLIFFIDRYVHDTAQAEDIALDVFTYLVVHKHRYDFRVSLKTYLCMLGRSRALDYIKRRKRLVPLSEAEQLPSPEPTLEERLLADHRKKAVREALSQLPAQLQEVVQLVYFEELTPMESAKVLKKSTKQVYNLLYRAKTALRAILGEEGEQLL